MLFFSHRPTDFDELQKQISPIGNLRRVRLRTETRIHRKPEITRDGDCQRRIRKHSSTQHEVLAAGLVLAAAKLIKRPDLAVGDDWNRKAAIHLPDRPPVRGRNIALNFGAAVDGDPVRAPFGRALRVFMDCVH